MGWPTRSRLPIFVGAIGKFWVWMAAARGASMAFGAAGVADVLRGAARRCAREEMRAALVARVDQQHAWVLAGNDRGVYGSYPAEQIS